MSQSEFGAARRRPRGEAGSEEPGWGAETSEDESAAADAVAAVLADDYARRIVELLGEGAATGPELAERMTASETTVYRRLNRLEEAGLVRSSLQVCPEGNHKQRYALAVERVAFSIGDGALEVATVAE